MEILQNNLLVSNKQCDRCELSSFCTNPCLITNPVPGEVKFMIVGEYPTDFEDGKEGVFLSKGGKLVRKILDEVIQVPAGSYYLTNLVKCSPTKGNAVTEVNAQACMDYLLDEILLFKPTVIVTLGNFVTKFLTGQEFVTSAHGKFFDKTFESGEVTFECKIIPTYSPIYTVYNEAALKPFAQDLEKAYLTSFNLGSTAKLVPFTYCKTVQDVELLCDYVEAAGICVPDFETIGVNTYATDFYPTLLSISFQPGHAYVIPLFHFDTWFTKDEIYEIMDLLNARIFQNPNVIKANHNIKYELHVLNWFGIKGMRGRIDDTMLMHHYLDEAAAHGLKDIVMSFMPEYAGYEDSIKKWAWDKVPLQELSQYAATDTVMTLMLRTTFQYMLMQDKESYFDYRNNTIPALVALYEAEREGMQVDIQFLEDSIAEVNRLEIEQERKLSSFKQVKRFIAAKEEELRQKALEGFYAKIKEKELLGADKRAQTAIKNAEAKISEIKAGAVNFYASVNFGAPAQLAGLLYSNEGFGFKMPYDRTKRKEMPLTGRDVIIRFTDKTGFIDEFLLFKTIEKMKGTYLEGMHKLLDVNNKIHTSFLLHGTESGRLCVGEDTLITTDRGYVRLGDIIPKKEGVIEVDNLSALTHTGRYKKITHAVNKGYEDMYLVTLESGHSLHCTMSHIFYTDKGWLSLKDIINLPTECTVYYDSSYLPQD